MRVCVSLCVCVCVCVCVCGNMLEETRVCVVCSCFQTAGLYLVAGLVGLLKKAPHVRDDTHMQDPTPLSLPSTKFPSNMTRPVRPKQSVAKHALVWPRKRQEDEQEEEEEEEEEEETGTHGDMGTAVSK